MAIKDAELPSELAEFEADGLVFNPTLVDGSFRWVGVDVVRLVTKYAQGSAKNVVARFVEQQYTQRGLPVPPRNRLEQFLFRTSELMPLLTGAHIDQQHKNDGVERLRAAQARAFMRAQVGDGSLAAEVLDRERQIQRLPAGSVVRALRDGAEQDGMLGQPPVNVSAVRWCV